MIVTKHFFALSIKLHIKNLINKEMLPLTSLILRCVQEGIICTKQILADFRSGLAQVELHIICETHLLYSHTWLKCVT